MSDIKNGILAWKLAITWGAMFVINSICMLLAGSLATVDWSTLNGQKKLVFCLALVENVTGTLMAFLSKAAKKADISLPFDDTTFVQKTTTLQQKISSSQ